MLSLSSSFREATPHRASIPSTGFFTRIASVLLFTCLDVVVLLKCAVQGLRDSVGQPILHSLIVVGVVAMALSLANAWYKTLRYRQ